MWYGAVREDLTAPTTQQTRVVVTNNVNRFAPDKSAWWLPVTASVVWNFVHAMSDLVRLLKGTRRQYVRCLKSNEDRAPTTVDLTVILPQLVASGLIQTITLRRDLYDGPREPAALLRMYDKHYPVASRGPEEALATLTAITAPRLAVGPDGTAVVGTRNGASPYERFRNSPTVPFLWHRETFWLHTRATSLIDRLREVQRERMRLLLVERARLVLRHRFDQQQHRFERVVPSRSTPDGMLSLFCRLRYIYPHRPHEELWRFVQEATQLESVPETALNRLTAQDHDCLPLEVEHIWQVLGITLSEQEAQRLEDENTGRITIESVLNVDFTDTQLDKRKLDRLQGAELARKNAMRFLTIQP